MFKSIAFGGGGARGGLMVGGLAAYEKTVGPLVFPNGVYGCSIGSILATAVAFQLNATQIKSIFDDHFDLDNILPPVRLTHVVEGINTKGLFSMEMLEQTITKAFDQQGISLRGKMIADTPQKLYIVASNMTTQKPTLLTGQVPILDAIKCSCCLPFVFRPQVLFHQVYLDGGLFLDNIESIVPKGTLVFHIGPMSETIFEKDLDTMPISTYAYKLYRAMRNTTIGPNVIWLQNDTIGLLHDLTPEDKKTLYDSGYSTTFRFLTKRLAQKLE
jgi:hypothetical protein